MERATEQQPDAAAATCANCGAADIGRFCPGCGQAAHLHRDLRGLLHDIGHGVFHFEGRIWHTLPLLAWRPGELTRRYVQGQRTRFVPPVSLFLFCVFLMFAVFAIIDGGKDTELAPADMVRSAQRNRIVAEIKAIEAAQYKAKLADRAKLTSQLAEHRDDLRALDRGYALVEGARGSPLDIHIGWPWLDRRLTRAETNPNLLLYKIKSSAYKFSWTLIPLSLPFLWLLFPFRRGVGLYDHAIFATYSLSFMTLLVVALAVASAVGVSGGWILLALTAAAPLHMYRQLKGAYLLGWFGALWRTFALLGGALVVSLLFLMLLLWMGLD